jgi:EmrB/QacA subfamily drug resistance transporter
MAAGFLTMLDISIVNVALPSIETTLHAGPTNVQLIIAGYTLASGLVLVPAGRLGDVYGRRTMFVIGVAAFALMSLGAGLSTNDTMLSLFRVFQGASAGILNPQVSGLIQQMFRGLERGRAFGIFGATIGVSTALGPVAGGAIIALAGPEYGWRWVFFLNVPISAVVLPMALRLLPSAQARGPHTKLDLLGIALIGLGTMTFMIPFVLSGDEGERILGPHRWWWLAAALVLIPVVYFWERRYQRRYKAAVLDPALLGNVSFRFGAALGMAYFAGFTAIFLIVTLVLQEGLGYSALQAGVISTPFAIGSAIVAWRSGRWVGRWGRKLVVAGLTVAIIGLLAADAVLRWAPTADMAWALALTLMIAGIGSGSIISSNQTLTFAEIPSSIGGVAGGVLQVGQRVGGAVGVSAALAAFFTEKASKGASVAAADALLLSISLIGVAWVIAIVDSRRRSHDGISPT